MATRQGSKTPITQKKAHTGDYVQGEKTEAIKAEISRKPNSTARQIAENLEKKGIEVSMSHIYRQLSNMVRRNKTDRRRSWVGTTLGSPAPAGAIVSQAKAAVDSIHEPTGLSRSKEQIAAIEAVGEVLDTGRRSRSTGERISVKTGMKRRGSK